MKGNEARVVFFLHPVDQLKDGQVSKVQPLRRSFVVSVLLLVGLLLGLGVLVFVLFQFGVETEVPFTTATEAPATERTGEPVPTTLESLETEGSTEATSNQSRANDSTKETELPTASKEKMLPSQTLQPLLTISVTFHAMTTSSKT